MPLDRGRNPCRHRPSGIKSTTILLQGNKFGLYHIGNVVGVPFIGYSQAVSTLLSASPLPFLDVNEAKTHPEKKPLRSIDNFTSFVTQFSLAIFGFTARCVLASVAHRTMGRSQPVVNLVPFLLFSLLPLWTFYQEDLLTGTVVSQRMTSRCSGLHQSH